MKLTDFQTVSMKTQMRGVIEMSESHKEPVHLPILTGQMLLQKKKTSLDEGMYLRIFLSETQFQL